MDFSPVANLKPARALAPDDDLAVHRAQLDLANVAPSNIDFLRNQGRAYHAAAGFALRHVAASVDANFCRNGIEVRLKHTLVGLDFLSWRIARARCFSNPGHRASTKFASIRKMAAFWEEFVETLAGVYYADVGTGGNEGD
jgi:hypothetical protein